MPILYAQRSLQTVVLGPSVVSSLDHIGIGAMGVATRRYTTSSRGTCGGMATGKSNLVWISARGQARRNETAKAIADKEIQGRVGISRLELLDRMGAVIAHFSGQMGADLTLN